MAVAHADNRRRRLVLPRSAPAVARTRQRLGKFRLQRAAGLEQSVARHVAVSGSQGWSDRQMVSGLVLLNLAGGEGLDDLDRLEADGGLCRLVRAADAHGRTRRERRAEARRWRRQRSRTLPSPHATGRWLTGFHDAGEEARRQA